MKYRVTDLVNQLMYITDDIEGYDDNGSPLVLVPEGAGTIYDGKLVSAVCVDTQNSVID